MSHKITRRDLAAVLTSAAGAAAARAQQTSGQPEDLSAEAHDQIRKNAEALAKVDLPMDTEPAFQFKA